MCKVRGSREFMTHIDSYVLRTLILFVSRSVPYYHNLHSSWLMWVRDSYSLNFTHMHSCALIFTHIHSYSLNFTHIHSYSLIFTHIHSYALIFTHIHSYILFISRSAPYHHTLFSATQLYFVPGWAVCNLFPATPLYFVPLHTIEFRRRPVDNQLPAVSR